MNFYWKSYQSLFQLRTKHTMAELVCFFPHRIWLCGVYSKTTFWTRFTYLDAPEINLVWLRDTTYHLALVQSISQEGKASYSRIRASEHNSGKRRQSATPYSEGSAIVLTCGTGCIAFSSEGLRKALNWKGEARQDIQKREEQSAGNAGLFQGLQEKGMEGGW